MLGTGAPDHALPADEPKKCDDKQDHHRSKKQRKGQEGALGRFGQSCGETPDRGLPFARIEKGSPKTFERIDQRISTSDLGGAERRLSGFGGDETDVHWGFGRSPCSLLHGPSGDEDGVTAQHADPKPDDGAGGPARYGHVGYDRGLVRCLT